MRGPTVTVCLASALVGLALFTSAAGQSPQPVTQADCPNLPAVHVFTAWPSRLENLAFAGGAVYVSDSRAERLLRVDPAGRAEVVATFIELHGVVADAAGVIHFTARDGSEPEGQWRVWRLGPEGPVPYSDPTPGWNGMAFTDTGDLFLSDLVWGVHRIPTDDATRSETWLRAEGANGLVYDAAARVLYAALSDDQRSTILRIPIDDPNAATEIHLSFGAVRVDTSQTPPAVHDRAPSDPTLPLVPKILDDLTLGPDGLLYAAALGTGELLRIDPETGRACVLAKGLKEPTSVRVATGFGPYDGDLFVTAGGALCPLLCNDTRREPALLRVATGLEMPDVTPGTESSPEPVVPRTVPAPSLGPVLIALVAAFLTRSTGRARLPPRPESRNAR